jgi:ribosomal protein S18 acetylase RimI-like enzyme
VLLGSLGESRSMLVVGTAEGRIVAFATAEPTPTNGTAEVRYLGVDPDHWGRGLGGMILARVAHELASAGFSAAELLVYADNDRARRLYERMGWEHRDELSVHPRTGRVELRYRRRL